MRLFIALLALWGFGLESARAHDFWMVRDDGLRVRSGHYFPASEGGPQAKTIARLAVQGPGGEWQEWERTESVAWSPEMDAPGMYRAALIVQPPRAKEPFYFAQSLFVQGGAAFAWPAPLGTGLEIVGRGVEDGVELRVLREGVTVRAALTVQASGRSSKQLQTAEDTPAHLSLTRGVDYLVTASVGMQSVSLSFHWPE